MKLTHQLSNLALVGAVTLGTLSAVGLGTGCSPPKVSLADGPREYVPVDYDQVLERWTRSGSLVAINELDDLLSITSTYESWDFRWAYVVRYSADYRFTVEQRKELLESTLADSRKTHQFYIALHGANRRELDLSKKTSAWVVRLIDDHGNETAAAEITPIKKPSAIERTYFPYTNVWRVAFRVRFPATIDGHPTIAPDAQWFGLRFAGAQGNSDIIWQVGAAN
ncbi:MAG: hypothetical protein U0165_14300 [Polyangiaceae bacterium]